MKKICIITTLTTAMLLLVGCSSSLDKSVETDNNFYKVAETSAANIKNYYKNQDANDEKVAENVVNQINELGEITIDSANSVASVRASYDALNDKQKELVTNYETLTKAEEILKSKQDEDLDKKAAENVINKINNLGEITINSADSIASARVSYDALTDKQKELVTNYETLTNAEETLKSKQSAEETANNKVVNNEKSSNGTTNNQTTSNNEKTNNNSSKPETLSKLECTAANAKSYMNKSINSFMSATGVYRSGTEDCLNPDGLAYSFDGFTVYTDKNGNIIAVE